MDLYTIPHKEYMSMYLKYRIGVYFISILFFVYFLLTIFWRISGENIGIIFIIFTGSFSLISLAMIRLIIAQKKHKYYVDLESQYLEVKLPLNYVKCSWSDIKSVEYKSAGAYSDISIKIKGTNKDKSVDIMTSQFKDIDVEKFSNTVNYLVKHNYDFML